jgi:hypothetical protein
MSSTDRRSAPRFALDKPAKIFLRGTWRYLPARTRDVSSSGALLELPEDRDVHLGDMVDLAIAERASSILRNDEFIAGRIVRIAPGREPGSISAAVHLSRPPAQTL